MPTRLIKMSDYIRAMNTVDEYGTPKATLPIFTGYPLNYELWNDREKNNPVPNPSSPQYWALNDADYPLYMTLFYYSDMIMPAVVVRNNPANPDYSLDPSGQPTTSIKGRGKVRTDKPVLNGDGAQIPLATDDVHKVAQFSGFDAKRRESTAHGGEPTILGTMLNADTSWGYPTTAVTASTPNGMQLFYNTRRDLYDQLRKYWNGKWVYDSQDPDWPDPIMLDIPRWYNFDGAEGGPTGKAPEVYFDGRGATKVVGTRNIANKYQYLGLSDYDLDEIEEEETRTLEVLFPAPPSVGPSEDDTVEFDYLVKP
jgi:hypothetical protein